MGGDISTLVFVVVAFLSFIAGYCWAIINDRKER